MTYANGEYYREYQRLLIEFQLAPVEDKEKSAQFDKLLCRIQEADAPSIALVLREDPTEFYWRVLHAILCWPEESWGVLGLMVLDQSIPEQYRNAIKWRAKNAPLTQDFIDKQKESWLPKGFGSTK